MRHVGSVKQLAVLCMSEVITGMTAGESTDHIEMVVSTESGEQFSLQLPMVGPRANMFVEGVFDALRDPIRRADLAAGDLSAIMPIPTPDVQVCWEYKTTHGWLHFKSSRAFSQADDPHPPSGEGWEMCGSVLGARDNEEDQPILWFWRRRKV